MQILNFLNEIVVVWNRQDRNWVDLDISGMGVLDLRNDGGSV